MRLEQEGCQPWVPRGAFSERIGDWSECSSGEKKAKLCAARPRDAQGWALFREGIQQVNLAVFMHSNMFFTESLILAQNERWRRV